MNGRDRILHAARRKDWSVSKDRMEKSMWVQDFISDELELFIQVTYSGCTIKAAKLWDFSTHGASVLPLPSVTGDGVPFQRLHSAHRDKAARIENVLLGNGRRF